MTDQIRRAKWIANILVTHVVDSIKKVFKSSY